MTVVHTVDNAIAFDGVTLRYTQHDVLRSVSFDAPRGGFTVLLGSSGAGKSSLLRLINGLASAQSGRMRILGSDVTPAARRDLRRRIATIYQHFNLVDRASVAHNIISGALPDLPLWRVAVGAYPDHLKRRACELAAVVGLDGDLFFQRAELLSGGQQQRVGVARAFMLRPEIVLADEPVASLDPRIARDVLQLIRNEARAAGSTVVCSLHQLDLACDFADHIVALRAGEVVYSGPADVFWRAPIDIQSLYGTAA